jgi:hypothetical protein
MKHLVIAVLICLGTIVPAAAQHVEERALRGITKLDVVIEDLPPPIESIISAEQLKTDVEQRLKQNGLRIESGRYIPYILVSLTALKHRSLSLFVYNVDVSFQQEGLIMNGTQLPVTTWHRGTIGYAGMNEFRDEARSAIRDLVDKFLNDYLSVNPKK